MALLRISAETSRQSDSLKARMARVQTALGCGTTTTEALARADAELAALVNEARSLRIHVRGDIATATRREREDRSTRKVG